MRIYPNFTVDKEFKTLGDLGYTGSMNDRQFSFLRAQGYQNALADMMNKWKSYSPLDLFSVGEQGAWYDPSDITTLFQDTAGTTPVTATGQSVARINDKSGRGNHATQATLANRPIYGVHPFGGRRNLLTFTEQFDNAAWSKVVGATVSANTAVAPDGTTTADTISFNTTNGNRVEQSGGTAINGETLTVSMWLKGTGTINLNVGTDTGVGGVGETTITLTSSWVRYSTSVTFSSPTGSRRAMVVWRTGNTATSVDVWGAQIEAGSTATPYQRVTDRYNVTEAGVSSVSYLFFDGVNDSLATPSINFTSTDKMTVFAGVRKLSDAAIAILTELSSSVGSNAGSFYIAAPESTSEKNFTFASRGSVLPGSPVKTGELAAPYSAVLGGIANISGDSMLIRVNGTQAATSSADQGTGTYGNYPLFIGARNSASLFFSGHLYSLIVRGAQSNTGQISAAEAWVANKTGVTI
jgi:hypothetical protein